jgi:hypothetical protein
MKRTIVNTAVLSVAGFLCVFIPAFLFTGCGKKVVSTGSVTLESLKKAVKTDAAKALNEFGVKVEESALCRNVIDRTPDGAGEVFDTAGQMDIYLFTKINSENPSAVIYHRFLTLKQGLSGPFWVETYVKELQVTGKSYKTWTFKTVWPGFWRADVLAGDRKTVISSTVFEVRGPMPEALKIAQDPSFNISRLSIEQAEACENVDQVKKEPINPGTAFSIEAGRTSRDIYLWLRLKTEKFPVMITLRWSRLTESANGTRDWVPEYAFSPAVNGKEWRTWAYKTCTAGRYRIDCIAADGKTILKSIEIEVKPPGSPEGT